MNISREQLDKMSDMDIKERIDEIDLYLGGDGCYNPKLKENEYESLSDEREQLVTELQVRDWELSQIYDPSARYALPEGLYDTIYKMSANEVVHTDEYMDDVVLAIKKDADFRYNSVIMDREMKEEFNMVTVDFEINGKSIASTSDIHVQDLEQTLNDIRDGKTGCLIDETRPLADVVKEYKETQKGIGKD